MNAIEICVAPQCLQAIHQEFGSDLCSALELLKNKLTEMPMHKRSAAPREYAELREAKALVKNLKFPDSTESMSPSALAWALQRIATSYHADGQHQWASLFSGIAGILGIDLAQLHPIPLDLSRRISNEIQLLTLNRVAVPLKKTG